MSTPVNAELNETYADECRRALAQLVQMRENVRRARVELGGPAESGADLLREEAERLAIDADDLEAEGEPDLAAEIRASVTAALAISDDPADTADTAARQERATDEVRAAIARAQETGDPAHALDAAKHLAALDHAHGAPWGRGRPQPQIHPPTRAVIEADQPLARCRARCRGCHPCAPECDPADRRRLLQAGLQRDARRRAR